MREQNIASALKELSFVREAASIYCTTKCEIAVVTTKRTHWVS
jgi:hypothetical protein